MGVDKGIKSGKLRLDMTLTVTAKCSDMFCADLNDKDGNIGERYNGYVPTWFPNSTVQHYGDYVELEIDIEAGRIVNWKKPTKEQLNKTFKCKI